MCKVYHYAGCSSYCSSKSLSMSASTSSGMTGSGFSCWYSSSHLVSLNVSSLSSFWAALIASYFTRSSSCWYISWFDIIWLRSSLNFCFNYLRISISCFLSCNKRSTILKLVRPKFTWRGDKGHNCNWEAPPRWYLPISW